MTSPASQHPKGGLRLTRTSQLAYASFFFSYYGYIGIVMPFVSLYLAYRGFSVLEIASLMTVFQFTRIFGPFAWGWLADYWHARVLVLRLSAFSALLVFVLLPWLNGFTAIFIWLLILNSLTSALAPIGDAVVVEALTKQAHGAASGFDKHYGKLRLWGSLGFIVAVMLGGVLTQRYGIALFPELSVGLLVVLCLTVLTFKDARHTTTRIKPTKGSLWEILKLREVHWFFFASFCMVFAHAALYSFYSLYLEKLGYSKFAIGVMWTVGVIAEILFFWFQGSVFARFSLRALMYAACAAAIVRFALIGNALEFGWAMGAVLVFAQLLHAFTFGVQHSASLKLLQRWFAGPLQASGQALFTSIAYGLGGSCGGLVAGWIWTHWGAGQAFLSSSAVAVVGAVAVWRCFAQTTKKLDLSHAEHRC